MDPLRLIPQNALAHDAAAQGPTSDQRVTDEQKYRLCRT
jgi:hypothetical protein